MSHFDYEQSKQIARHGFQFQALIMAAMRQADSDNLKLLQAVFPEVWTELERRYNAPFGMLPEEYHGHFIASGENDR